MEVYQTKLGSEALFKEHRFLWKLFGFVPPRNYRRFYILYSMIINGLVTIWYPIHLIISILNMQSRQDFFRSLSAVLTIGLCSIKILSIAYRLGNVQEIDRFLVELDERIESSEDKEYHRQKMFKPARRIAYLLYAICISCGLVSEVVVIITGYLFGWKLMYPGYFPFDAYASTWIYAICHIYQFFGASWIIAQNFVNDTYGPMCLALLAGHMNLLGKRIARIGHDNKMTACQNEAELLHCIQDHKRLLVFHAKLTDIISFIMFFHVLIAGLNFSISIIYIVFYANDIWTLAYYVIYLSSLVLESFPTCYYGTKAEIEFEKFYQTIFYTNWLQQSKNFQQNIRILGERAKNKMIIKAGNVVPVSLQTFISTLRMAYSFFTVISQIK